MLPSPSSQAKGPDGDLELSIDLISEHADQTFVRDVNCVDVVSGNISMDLTGGRNLSELTNSFNGLEQQFNLNQQGLHGGTDDAAETTGSDRSRLRETAMPR